MGPTCAHTELVRSADAPTVQGGLKGPPACPQNLGMKSGMAHLMLLQAPTGDPSEIAIRIVQIFRMQRLRPMAFQGATGARVAFVKRFAALQTGQNLLLWRRAAPFAVSTIRDDLMVQPLSMRTNPSCTAFSQTGIRGQLLRHASMVSP
jgi:hypothetical protein